MPPTRKALVHICILYTHHNAKLHVSYACVPSYTHVYTCNILRAGARARERMHTTQYPQAGRPAGRPAVCSRARIQLSLTTDVRAPFHGNTAWEHMHLSVCADATTFQSTLLHIKHIHMHILDILHMHAYMRLCIYIYIYIYTTLALYKLVGYTTHMLYITH